MATLFDLCSDVTISIVTEWVSGTNFSGLASLDNALTNKKLREHYLETLGSQQCLFKCISLGVEDLKLVNWMIRRRVKVQSLSAGNSFERHFLLISALAVQQNYLESLSLEINSVAKLNELTHAICNCQWLKSISITSEYHVLVDATESLETILFDLNPETITHIKLVRFAFREVFVLLIGDLFPNLESLEMADCEISAMGGLDYSIRMFTKLTNLDASSFPPRLLEFVCKNAAHLKALDCDADASEALRHCSQLTNCVAKFGDQLNLFTFMNRCANLTSLELIDCHVTDDTLLALNKCSSRLSEFGIGRIDDEPLLFSLEALGGSLKFMPNLKALNLYLAVNVDPVIAAAAQHLSKLESYQSFFGGCSSPLMVALITHNPRLVRFSSYPAVNDEVVLALATRRMTDVMFYLSPDITDGAVLALLKSSPCLNTLDLSFCSGLTERVLLEAAKVDWPLELYMNIAGFNYAVISTLDLSKCRLKRITLNGSGVASVNNFLWDMVCELQQRSKRGRVIFKPNA